MKKIPAIPACNIPVTIMLLIIMLSLASQAQEKLSQFPAAAKQAPVPIPYVQKVTQDSKPITNQFQLHPGKPSFLQKFSNDNTTLLSQSKIIAVPSPALMQEIKGSPLPVAAYSQPATGSIVASVCNDSPIGTDDQYVTGHDKTLTIAAPGFLANDNDLQGEALTATLIVDNVDHGSLAAFPDGSFTYTPSPGFIGTDQFQYKMKDASNNPSEAITVTIEVSASGNRTPIGTNDRFGALAGRTLAIAAPGFLANDIDQDGDVITATLIVDNVDHGSLSAFPDGSFNYTPTAGFTGTDQFQYKMRDAEFNASEAITVIIQVLEGNRKPIGTNDLFGVVTNTTLNIPAPGFLINDIDPDGDALTATLIVDNVDHGSLSAFPNGSFSYTPTPGFTGTDQFQYKMRDSELNGSEPITVTFQVIGSGVLPFGSNDSYRTSDGSILTVAAPGFLINDVDQNGEALTATLIVDNVDHGSLSAFPNGSFTYTPTPGFVGTDQFQYKMRDASNNQSEAITVTIEVAEKYNRKPVGTNDAYSALANTSLSIPTPGFLANDIDQDGDVITATLIVDNVAHGSLSAFPNGSFNYTPTPGYTGTDQFKYKMRDASFNQSEDITVTIQVYEGNRAPLGTNDVYTVIKNTPLNIAAGGFLTNDYDPDGDALTATLITDGVDHGSLSAFPDGSFSYTPTAGFTGTDQFKYQMRDSKFNSSEPVTVTLVVVGPNLPPVASAGNITVECTGPSGTTVSLDGSNSTDPEGGALIYTWYENNNVIAGPSSAGTSDVGFSTGVHQVKLKVEDVCGLSSEASFVVTVQDATGPLVTASLIPTGSPDMYSISCNSSDICSQVVSSSSLILIPQLTNPTISLKNKNGYSLEIDMVKNTVKAEAPDAAAFWALINSAGGVAVLDGQVIEAKYEKNKHKFSFDAQGKLLSVKGDVVTLRCTATDGNGNTGVSEASLPMTLPANLISAIPPQDKLSMLANSYPNPFSNRTTIRFRLSEPAFVQVTILDQIGQVVEEIARRQMPAGEHAINWEAANRKPGIYYYRIQYKGKQFSNKIILLR